jgi:hypothetical protein
MEGPHDSKRRQLERRMLEELSDAATNLETYSGLAESFG